MEDFDKMTATEMMVRRETAQQEIAQLIGQFLFAYSPFVTALHLCVAWFDSGKDLDDHAARAGGLSVADLLKDIEKRALSQYGEGTDARSRYKAWCNRAGALRTVRNDIAHARWEIEAFGRHAIATTTSVLVAPMKQREFTADRLRALCEECSELAEELSGLRTNFPL